MLHGHSSFFIAITVPFQFYLLRSIAKSSPSSPILASFQYLPFIICLTLRTASQSRENADLWTLRRENHVEVEEQKGIPDPKQPCS